MVQQSSLLRSFGITATGEYESPLSRMFRTELADVIESNAMACVCGSPGSGKTHLMHQVERQLDGQVTFVKVLDFSDREVRMASILANLVLGLSSELPKRSSMALSHQVIRLLGETYVRQKQRVCLVIDDAQRLHPSTLTALKILRERDFAGHAPLLSIILLGWPDLAATIRRRKDILWRTEMMMLTEQEGWMTFPERVRYLDSVFGQGIDAETRLTIAAQCQVPEEMNTFVITKMREARRAGFDRLDVRTVASSPREIVEKLGITYPEIAAEMGMSTTTAHRAVHDGETNPHHEKARKAIQNIAARLTTLPKTG